MTLKAVRVLGRVTLTVGNVVGQSVSPMGSMTNGSLTQEKERMKVLTLEFEGNETANDLSYAMAQIRSSKCKSCLWMSRKGLAQFSVGDSLKMLAKLQRTPTLLETFKRSIGEQER